MGKQKLTCCGHVVGGMGHSIQHMASVGGDVVFPKHQKASVAETKKVKASEIWDEAREAIGDSTEAW